MLLSPSIKRGLLLFELNHSIKINNMNEKEIIKDQEDNNDLVVCPECLTFVHKEELEMFGGLCEECSGAFD